MKSIKRAFLVMVGMLFAGSSYGMQRFSGVGHYLPSWQTVRESVPPAAYWPSITAGTMAILGLDLPAILGLNTRIQREPGISRSIASAYMIPYVLARNLYLLRQFMVIRHYAVGDLLNPNVRREFYSYLNNKGLDMVAASGYYFYFPLVLLLGGHLYHTYR